MRREKPLYPGLDEAERMRDRLPDTGPDGAPEMFTGPGFVVPNYEAFPGWSPEAVLAFLNID